MKKKLLVLMMLVFSLTACNADKDKAQEPQKTEQTQEQAKTDENKTEEKASESEATKVSIVVMDEVNNKEILKEDAEIKKDENLQSYLEKNHKAVFEKGMMTELEGVKQIQLRNNTGCIMLTIKWQKLESAITKLTKTTR